MRTLDITTAVVVEELTADAFEGVDVAMFDVPDEVSYMAIDDSENAMFALMPARGAVAVGGRLARGRGLLDHAETGEAQRQPIVAPGEAEHAVFRAYILRARDGVQHATDFAGQRLGIGAIGDDEKFPVVETVGSARESGIGQRHGEGRFPHIGNFHQQSHMDNVDRRPVRRAHYNPIMTPQSRKSRQSHE